MANYIDWTIKNIGKIYKEAIQKYEITGIKYSPEKLEKKVVSLIAHKYKIKPKVVYAIFGKVSEDARYYGNAAKYYKKVGMNKKANEMLKKEKASKTLDSVVTSILAFGGLGLIFSFFSKPDIISPSNVQLAPPFPNYMIYIFAVMLIGGIGYFVAKHFLKKKDIIPLSF